LGASFSADGIVIGEIGAVVEFESDWFVKEEEVGLLRGIVTEVLVVLEALLIPRLVVIAGLND
jgi:hypothetical protein